MIKYIFVILFISISLFGRLNPFEPADNTEESNLPRPVTNLNSKDDGSRTVKIVSDEENKPKELLKKEIKPKTVESKVKEEKNIVKETPKNLSNENMVSGIEATIPKKVQVKKEKMVSKMVKTSSKKNTQLKKKITKKLAQKNRKKPVQKKQNRLKRYNVLPLLTIDLMGKNLTIKITSNDYKIIKYYEDQPNGKFVFDFKASLGIPTAKEVLESPYYESYIVGNHPDEGFFRVVIPVKKSTSNYKVTIKNNIGMITHN